MNDIVTFWDRVNYLIKQSGFTQASLSEKCGFSLRRIENLSAGKRLPDCFEAVSMANALDTTVEYLVTGKMSAEHQADLKAIKKKVLDFAMSIQ